MRLRDIVDTHRQVEGTSSRTEKTRLLAELMARAPDGLAAALVMIVSGQSRQGRLGIGPAMWRRVRSVEMDPDALPLTLSDLDRALDELAAVSGSGASDRRAKLLASLLRRASPPERDFLAGLLLGGVRQGAAEGVALEALAQAASVDADHARQEALRRGGLEGAAVALLEGQPADGQRQHAAAEFVPISPMLATTAESVEDAIERAGAALVEAKADGARVQVHRSGDSVRVFTRRLNDITPSVPEVVAAVTDLPGGDLILDGEALVWDEDGPQPFQTTMRRIGGRPPSSDERVTLPLRTFWFDCLRQDDEELLDLPLEERRRRLEALVPADALLPSLRVEPGPDAQPADEPANLTRATAFLEDMRARGFEGVMVKALDSPYAAGRRGRAWMKVKPVHTLDLVVLAAEWGSGRRKGWLSNLHLGARDPDSGGFVMLGKTFKGMTDQILEWQTEALQALETGRDARTVYVRPELVVEIAFDGVQASPRYPGGVTLRFARLKAYRADKSAAEADTLESVRALLPPSARSPRRRGRGRRDPDPNQGNLFEG